MELERVEYSHHRHTSRAASLVLQPRPRVLLMEACCESGAGTAAVQVNCRVVMLWFEALDRMDEL